MRALRRLLGLFSPSLGWMLLGIALALLTLLGSIGLMALSGWFIAAMGLAGIAGASINYFTPAAFIRALAMLRTGGRYAERLVTHEATLRLLARLRVWFYERLEPLAPAGLEDLRSGDLLSRIRADIDTLDNLYLRILAPLAVAAVAVAGITWFLAWHDPGVAAVTLGFLLLAGLALPLLVHRLAGAAGGRQVETGSHLRSAVIDGVQGLGELTLYGADARQAARIRELGDHWAADQERMGGLEGLSQAGLTLAANLALWSVLLLAIPLLRSGSLAGPELAMIALLTLAAFEAVLPLPQALRLLGETQAAAGRLFAIADREPAVRDPASPSPSPAHFDLLLEGVSFAYAPAQTPALQGFSLRIPQGRRVALVGPSGAGKSTLTQLLLRLRDPQAGRITLGGHDLRSFAGDDLRRHLAVVPQETHLFNTTIRANLLLAAPEADQAALERACRSAGIHAWIQAQPRGYDTWVGEAGLRLSGGQARRIAIARALLREAPILILDEPTEGLDPATERAVMEDLRGSLAGRTLILIGHRLTALEAMDEVVVLEEGRIVERGTPAALMAAGGRLRALQDLIPA